MKTGKNAGKEDISQAIAPTYSEEDTYFNNLTQHSANKRKQDLKNNDTSKKKKTV